MKRFPPISDITPEKFELLVKRWLNSTEQKLESFETMHLERIQGFDGEFKFDVTARFTALGGAEFLVIVECKKHKSSIKRDVIQTLRDKQQSVGAHKAMVVSTSEFQSGAIQYASLHNIALVQIVNGQAAYIRNGLVQSEGPIPETSEDYVGLFYGSNPGGHLIFPQLLSPRISHEIEYYLGQ